jgi:hypothetical protein
MKGWTQIMKHPGCLTFAGFFFVTCTLFAQHTLPATTSPAGAVESAATRPTIAVMSPPSAQTADSIAVLWDKPAGVSVEGYDVYLGTSLVATTKNTDYTLQGLAAAQEYEISVRARTEAGKILQSNSLRIATKPRPEVFDITKYGAVGDGKTLNTRAIQAAIDACGPGGVVRIPAGVFLSGALFLKSEMTLHLDEGAVLLGSSDTKDYPLMKYRFEGRETTCYASLINTPATKGARWRDITIGCGQDQRQRLRSAQEGAEGGCRQARAGRLYPRYRPCLSARYHGAAIPLLVRASCVLQ